jgi:hypothetical protein
VPNLGQERAMARPPCQALFQHGRVHQAMTMRDQVRLLSTEASVAVMARGAGVPGSAGNGSRTGVADREYTLPVIKAYRSGGAGDRSEGLGCGAVVA